MKHIILGNGNLGNAIATEISKRNQKVLIFSASNGWHYPANPQPIYDEIPDHIWVTVGAGSVEQAKANYTPFIDLHIKLPTELTQHLTPHTSLHLFSTDYVVDRRGKSLYALSKKTMEEAITLINRPLTYIYRIGSLYGTHKPENCFPYKLKKNSLKNTPTLPLNYITPTPADWVATTLLDNLEELPPETSIFNVAPQENCTVQYWGWRILGKHLSHPDNNSLDPSRPAQSNIGCNLPVTDSFSWLDLWLKRERKWKEILDGIS